QLEVAMNGARDIRRRRQHAERRHDQQKLHDHERCILVDVSQRAADLNAVRRHRAERHEEEQREENVEEWTAEVISQLEFEDVPGHAAFSSATLPLSVEK